MREDGYRPFLCRQHAIMAGHEANQKIISFIEEIKAEIGKPKFEFASLEPDHDMFEAIKAFAEEDVKVALDTDDKRIRDERLKPIYEAVHAKFDEIYPESEALIDECLYKTQKFIVRRWLLDEQKRVDGNRTECCDCENLSLSSCEHTRTVNSRNYANL